MPAIDFVLTGLDSTLSMDLSGALAGVAYAALDVSATAVFYVKTSDMVKVFKFQTDSFDVNNVDSADIKYFVHRDTASWPADLSLNPAHAAMIANAELTTGVDADKNLLKHDFVRYLSLCLFNTVHAVDLFSNESELLQNIVEKGVLARKAMEGALDAVNTSSVAAGMYGPDGSGNKYTTNALTGNTNICRELMLQIANHAAPRFHATANSQYEQGVPLLDGDSFNFKVTVHGATNQYQLTDRPTAFDARVYGIKIVLAADAAANWVGGAKLNVTPVEGAPSPANEYPYASA